MIDIDTSQLVSFEQAKALKKLGFPQDEKLYHLHYMDNGMIDSHDKFYFELKNGQLNLYNENSSKL